MYYDDREVRSCDRRIADQLEQLKALLSTAKEKSTIQKKFWWTAMLKPLEI